MFINLPVSAVSAGINNNGNIIQLQTPDYIRGRMTSVNQIFFMGGPQLGEVEADVVAQLLGAPFAVVTGGDRLYCGGFLDRPALAAAAQLQQG